MYIKRGVELGLIVVVVAIVAVIGLFFEGGVTGAAVGVVPDLDLDIQE
tara:strand:- start:397 stop:540 length:144 start_codon:yes stop_codon:yes gene_type:complete